MGRDGGKHSGSARGWRRPWTTPSGTNQTTVLTCTYVVRAPCQGCCLYVDERELRNEQRSGTVPCPRCARIWVARFSMPQATWSDHT